MTCPRCAHDHFWVWWFPESPFGRRDWPGDVEVGCNQCGYILSRPETKEYFSEDEDS